MKVPVGESRDVHEVDGVEELLRELEADAEVDAFGVALEDDLAEVGGHALGGDGFWGADYQPAGLAEPAEDGFGGQVAADVLR